MPLCDENPSWLTCNTCLAEDEEEPSCNVSKNSLLNTDTPQEIAAWSPEDQVAARGKHTLLVPKVTGQEGWYLWSSNPTCTQGLLHEGERLEEMIRKNRSYLFSWEKQLCANDLPCRIKLFFLSLLRNVKGWTA